jgi:hypothetical protein
VPTRLSRSISVTLAPLQIASSIWSANSRVNLVGRPINACSSTSGRWTSRVTFDGLAFGVRTWARALLRELVAALLDLLGLAEILVLVIAIFIELDFIQPLCELLIFYFGRETLKGNGDVLHKTAIACQRVRSGTIQQSFIFCPQ